MASLNGYSSGVQYLAAAPTQSQVSVGGATPPPSNTTAVIDGTPIRVVTLALASAVGLYALHLAGFRFNVGVSA